ncbi:MULTISPECIES: STAS-like domain-containing protein [Sphingobium]|uniref:DUF4325 domain-containing protein n=1 Tax=Sphingobium yanoikuyae TaxID=13690 RepID=A0A0J9FT99_SPHYA|nr:MULTISPECIES: STAS-like domain-containing protein [Sphingobium]ATP18283.1 hypothetical protein BV87_07675 [Sphingobium yanoikuyae]KMW31445.1 hypothetical protein BV87_24235 [Sphingobium yanoikuyae]MBR2270159.1 STAS-like domain-containing protein [Sphingobium sp.]
MRELHISVAKDYTRHPGPRYERQGEFSGERFRKVLVDRLKTADRIVVDLDGTSGFGSSFLDEAFGGLIRYEGMTRDQVRSRVIVKSAMDETYAAEVEEAVALAEPVKQTPRKGAHAPKH